MNDRDFTNRLEASLNRGMPTVPLPAVEPVNARYRMTTSTAGRRSMPRLTIAVAAVGLALLMGLVAAAASGTSPAILLSTTVDKVIVFVEQVTTHGVSAPAPSARETGVQPTAGLDSSANGYGSVTVPGPDSAAAPLATAPPEPNVEPEPVAPTQEPPPDPPDVPTPGL